MKFKVGGLTPEEDATRFRVAREAAGPDFVLCADANQGWTPAEAVRFARLVEDLDLHWFEEPCIWSNDRRAMRDVRFGGGVRVCAGQSEFSAGGCRDLMVEGAIDFCNFDSSWSGGATEWRRVAAAAVAFDVAMAHHEEPQIASHLLASRARPHLHRVLRRGAGSRSSGASRTCRPASRRAVRAAGPAGLRDRAGLGLRPGAHGGDARQHAMTTGRVRGLRPLAPR